MKVLIVDDEVRLSTALGRGLVADGFAVQVAHDGTAGLHLAQENRFDAVVLDIMLPGLSGYDVLKQMRASNDQTPVLMLSAKDGEHELADAFDLGADDFMVKPFSYLVLVARLRALQRRGRSQVPSVLIAGRVRLDMQRNSVTVDGTQVDLSPREYQLLLELMRRQGATVRKVALLEQVFALDPDTHPNVVEVYIGYLRRKLGRDLIVTVRGEGYRIGPA